MPNFQIFSTNHIVDLPKNQLAKTTRVVWSFYVSVAFFEVDHFYYYLYKNQI